MKTTDKMQNQELANNKAIGNSTLQSLLKVLICFMFIFSGTIGYADETHIPLIPNNNNDDIEISDEGNTKRDLNIISILPQIFYDNINDRISIISTHVTLESVIYFITDNNGFVLFSGEMMLPKGVEFELDLPNLPEGQYNMVIKISGSIFKGEFYVE